MNIGIIGTGNMGSALGRLWASKGHAVFFGSRDPGSKGSQVFHTAIYVGNGWFIQSSDRGVALAQLTGWYKKKFAWGRRPLREAGLEP